MPGVHELFDISTKALSPRSVLPGLKSLYSSMLDFYPLVLVCRLAFTLSLGEPDLHFCF
jgi:hypothetical protein